MPCFTKVKTKLLNVKDIKAAAAKLGIDVQQVGENILRLTRNGEHVTIYRENEKQVFSVRPLSGTNCWQSEIIQPLTVGYSAEVVIGFYESQGYVVSEQTDGEISFVQYT